MQASKQQIKNLDRLKKRPDFLRVQRNGNKWVSKSLILQASPNDLDLVRYGITVTRRVSKSAVTRNRIKRRLRAAACDILSSQATTGMDIVLIGRPETATKPYNDIKKDLSWCLDRLGFKESSKVK